MSLCDVTRAQRFGDLPSGGRLYRELDTRRSARRHMQTAFTNHRSWRARLARKAPVVLDPHLELVLLSA